MEARKSLAQIEHEMSVWKRGTDCNSRVKRKEDAELVSLANATGWEDSFGANSIEVVAHIEADNLLGMLAIALSTDDNRKQVECILKLYDGVGKWYE